MTSSQAFGSWPTPITSELVVRAARLPNGLQVDGDELWWSEGRPEEAGRLLSEVRNDATILPRYLKRQHHAWLRAAARLKTGAERLPRPRFA